jgi:hypothetical protein
MLLPLDASEGQTSARGTAGEKQSPACEVTELFVL